ncbi:MAG TPA: hypothetical protein PLM79_02850 [Syntrophobacteraceae bacterium]|nr:hypothetical protein [Syntrophobacteraceae bacterium]
MTDTGKLFSFEFVSLNLVAFFAFCNMSVFYSFFTYLERIGIAPEWRGFLIGLEPMAAFALRLAVVPVLHAGNAATGMLIALTMIVAALFSYGWVVTIPGLIVLRIFHGAAFVLLVSACMSLAVCFIPRVRSAQGFGVLSVSILLPYAVVPPVTEALLRHWQSEQDIYRSVTVLAIPAFAVLRVLRGRLGKVLCSLEGALTRRPTPEEIRLDLKERPVVLLLAVNLLVYFSTPPSSSL